MHTLRSVLGIGVLVQHAFGRCCKRHDTRSAAGLGSSLPGLTILAYRYEGLRFTDFRANLRALKDEMEEEQSGPYHQRPACRTFVRWVTLAGGTVRGVKRSKHSGSDAASGEDLEVHARGAACRASLLIWG